MTYFPHAPNPIFVFLESTAPYERATDETIGLSEVSSDGEDDFGRSGVISPFPLISP